MAKKLLFVTIVMTFLLISLVNAELISVDPCPDDTVITQDVDKIYLTSSCFDITFDKDYGQETPITFYDSYNDDFFDLKLHSLTEQNSVSINQQRLHSFEDITMTATIENGKVVYTSADGKIRLLYSVVGNQVKAGVEIINWTNYYTTSNFFLRTRIHKESTANSHFINLPATVDGVEQPLITQSEFSGNNEFVVQTLYTGGSFSFLEIDPIYQVNYSPIPAEHLESGDVAVDSDSQFDTLTDITTEMSDNLTNATYNTDDQATSGNAIAGAWAVTYDPSYSWFLRMYKTDAILSGTPTIYAYDDVDNISLTNYTDYATITGVGWKNFEVDSQMDYMTNTIGLNYTKLRFFTSGDGYFAEMYLRKEFNDTIVPTIHDCWVEESPVYCDDNALWTCNITDNLDVQTVTFTISGTNYSAIQNDNLWYYNMTFNDTTPVNETLTLTDVYATDIVNLTNHTSQSESINHDCQRIRLIHPYPLTVYDENSDVPIVIDLLQYQLDTYYANVTCSNGTTRTFTEDNFTKGVPSDNFDTDTEDINWEHAEIKLAGQTCDTDIDGTVPNKMSFIVDGGNETSTVQCGYNSILHADGNFDAELEFNFTLLEQDTYLTYRSAPTDTLSAFGIRAFISVGKSISGNYYTFGWNNGSGTQTQTISTTDTSGKLRIKRSNWEEGSTPIFNLYIWNHTTNDWQDIVGDIPLPNSARIQYIQIKPVSEGSNYGRAELEVDNFIITTDNYDFAVIENIALSGIINITIFANWTTPASDIVYTSINVTDINDAPSRPFIISPNVDEQVDYGNYTIEWGDVIDEEGNPFKFNISLLYANYSFHSYIVTAYGDENSTTYIWNVSNATYPEGNYSMSITAYETNTTPPLSNTDTLAGTFEIIYLACVEDWVAQYGSCQINDSQLKTYYDNNSCGTYGSLPVDNGTYVYCNYCTEDVVVGYSACYLSSGVYIRDVTYTDNNYFSCCAITGIVSDCTILTYPYNTTTQENCTVTLENDFELTLDIDLSFGFGFGGLASDKAHGKIWINDTNNTYYCVSYVETYEGQLIQTNPPYTKRTESTISIIPKEIEDREFFITSNGLANIYWTSDNLVIDERQYIFGVECAGNGQNLKSEVLATVGYDAVNEPITRWFWLKDNTVPIILGLLLIIIIAIFIGLIIRQVRY